MSKGEETRRSIVRTATEAASRYGLDQLSIGTLAREVGMSKSGLFAHFGSREGLQLNVLEHVYDRFVDVVVRPALRKPRGLPRFVALVEGWIDWHYEEDLPGGCVFETAAREFHDRPGAIRDLALGSQAQWRDTLIKAAELAVEEGHLRQDLDVAQLIFEAHGIVHAMLFYKRVYGERATDPAKRALASLLQRYEPTTT